MTARSIIWKNTFIETWNDFRAARGRNVLALIGIIIGTAAVIATLHYSHNAREQAIAEFSKLGTDVISLSLYSAKGRANFSLDDVKKMVTDVKGLSTYGALVSGNGTIRSGRISENTQTLAVTQDYYSIARAHIAIGRQTYDLDEYSPFVVLGSTVAENIAKATGKDIAIGNKILLQGESFEVIGILAPSPQNSVLMIDLNNSTLIPFKAARRIMRESNISGVALRLSADANEGDVSRQIQEWITQKDRNLMPRIQTAQQVIEAIDKQMRIYAYLLLGIGSISLLVSGVGIMNVMLISVLERRHEIGLRRAVGATQNDIVVLFLSNSLILCFIGAFIGLVIGTLAGWFFALLAGWSFAPSYLALPLGIALAVVVGLFFGIYPAVRASKLDIVMALRSE